LLAERESWGSRLGFILSAVGFAAGVGNIWRFPYIVGEYGGGVFLVFYLLVVFLIGIPLFSIEVALGKKTRKDPVGAYKTIRPGKPWFLNGYLNILTMLLIMGYVAPVVGWIFAYMVKSALGVFQHMSPNQIKQYFDHFTSTPSEVLLWTIFLVALLVVVLIRGLNKGIEKINKIMLPVLFVILLILIFRSLTLDGAEKGLVFYLKPDFSKFTLDGALAAVGQAFFSIGVAMAGSLVYGSYLRKKDKIVSNTVIIGLSDTMVAVLAGLIIFPIVFAFGLKPDSGFGLTFITMPNIFNQLPAGNLFATLFFLLFFLAAFTSFLGGAESVIAHLGDEWKIPRKTGTLITAGLILMIAVPSALSMTVFGGLDFAANNIFLILGALVMTIFVGWVWPIEQFFETAGIQSKIARFFWIVIIKFVAPMAIIIIWLSRLGVIG